MTTPSDLHRKVRQLDNDVQAIYGMLETIQTTQESHGLRLGSIDGRVAGHDARFDAIDSKLDTVLDLLGNRSRSADEA